MEVRVARGVFAGMVSGAVVGGLGLATLSVVNGPMEVPDPVVEEISEAPISAPQDDGAPEPVAEDMAEEMAEDMAEEMAEATPEPAADPTPDASPEPSSEPEAEPQPQPEAPAQEAPAASTPQPEADAAPAEEVGDAAPATPEAPAEPEMSDVQPDADQGAGEVTGQVPEPDTQPALAEADADAPRLGDAPAAPEASAPQPAPVTGESAPSPTPLPETEAELDPALAGATPPEGEVIAALPSADGEEASATAPATLAEPAQPPATPEGGEPPAPTRLKSDPIAPVGDLAPNVTTDRLPSIGEDEAAAEEVPELAAASPLAIERNAAGFDRPEGVPMMSVILRDDPAARAGLGDLENLPFPVSFIVAAEQADAGDAIAFYRAAGAEVLVSVQLPEGATAVDAEVTLQAHSGLLADAVGLQMGAGFQTTGATATQVAQVLVEGGHGLVSLPQGLNTGHKSALKAGVPAGLVFRELDNDGQSAAVIRRFLDNAAFKARQERGVILLGHARAETLQALIEWSLGNRAKSVAMAPVSAVLLDG